MSEVVSVRQNIWPGSCEVESKTQPLVARITELFPDASFTDRYLTTRYRPEPVIESATVCYKRPGHVRRWVSMKLEGDDVDAAIARGKSKAGYYRPDEMELL